ncbi:drc7 [Symbiodinium natans]|uniref:Dynein regulatory complex subunit 7 n=1 Tax=Symbiodinium natans TaxID=878477 RepID=A0A812JFC3_9DINO|nr:drc7 [Symbiodinium natans]
MAAMDTSVSLAQFAEDTTQASKEQPTQKEIRCRRLVAETANPSSRYVGNTPKEELLLEHVREFEDQFVNVYGNRFLFLCPPNEYGVPKFLPTTLRPTHLPYQEIYEYKSCAKFLADFFNYDELHPADRYPTVVPAPASVLNWQAGDCFDLSIALASLLIGVGYDAYCVSGFAPRFITTRNEARSACPQLDADIEETKEEDKQEEDEFVIPKKPPLRSEYKEAKARAEEADRIRLEEEEMKSDSEDDPSSDEDEFENRRIHCWVLVRKGSREVAEDMYLEPTTGRIYSVRRCPYLKIDLIWNHRNLWVNMQVCGASHVQLDLYNSRYFEYVMLDADNPSGDLGSGRYEGDDTGPVTAVPSSAGNLDTDESRRAEQTAQILDLPSPWSERPDIPREKFHARCFQGEKTIFYHKCKVEQYAPYTQDDGLVQRITLYKDVRRQIPLEIRERFKHRKDKLFERKRRPMQNETLERFLPGRPSTSASNAGGALKEYREISALSRELIFYKSRLDGLVRSVEIIGRKMFEYFEDRDDRLIYHSVTLDPTAMTSGTLRGGPKSKDTYPVDSVGEVPIKKMTQKYARNPEVPAEEDIAKISFYLSEQTSTSIYSSTGKIRVDYHREPGSLTFRQVMYHYEDGNLRRRPSSLPQPTQVQVHKLLQMQSSCRDTIMASHTSIQQELTTRRKDEISIRGMRSVSAGKKRDLTIPGSRDDVLEPSVYDLARESARVEGTREGAEEEKQEEQTSKVDILAPYLVDFINKETGLVQLDSLQAELVAKKCTTDFRKRLTDRAEIIQRRLEEEQELLRKRRAQMQCRGDSVERDERDFEQYQNQAMFRTQILEQRLARHEMQAIEKFQDLERMLQEDPRLAAMWQKEPAAVKG